MSWICYSNVVFGLVPWKRQSCSEYGFVWDNQRYCSNSFLDVDILSCLHPTRWRKAHRSSLLADYTDSFDSDHGLDSWYDHKVSFFTMMNIPFEDSCRLEKQRKCLKWEPSCQCWSYSPLSFSGFYFMKVNGGLVWKCQFEQW